MATVSVYLEADGCYFSGYYYDDSSTLRHFSVSDGSYVTIYAKNNLPCAVTSITQTAGHQAGKYIWRYNTASGGTAEQYVGNSGDTITVSYNRTIIIKGIDIQVTYDYYLYLYENDGQSILFSASDVGTTATSVTWYLSNYQPKKPLYTHKGWAATAGGTVVVKQPNGTVEQSYGGTNRYYAVWEKKSDFTWYGSGTIDGQKIKQGETRQMTGEMWDSFADKVDEVASACGTTVSISRPSTGTDMLASQYNTAITALQHIKNTKPTLFSSITIPNAVSQNSLIKASQFNGTGSIKDCLNKMIALL